MTEINSFGASKYLAVGRAINLVQVSGLRVSHQAQQKIDSLGADSDKKEVAHDRVSDVVK